MELIPNGVCVWSGRETRGKGGGREGGREEGDVTSFPRNARSAFAVAVADFVAARGSDLFGRSRRKNR